MQQLRKTREEYEYVIDQLGPITRKRIEKAFDALDKLERFDLNYIHEWTQDKHVMAILNEDAIRRYKMRIACLNSFWEDLGDLDVVAKNLIDNMTDWDFVRVVSLNPCVFSVLIKIIKRHQVLRSALLHKATLTDALYDYILEPSCARALAKAGFEYVIDAACLSKSDLMRIKGIGPKYADYILEQLCATGELVINPNNGDPYLEPWISQPIDLNEESAKFSDATNGEG